MKFQIADTTGSIWLSDDDTVSPEVMVQYADLFARGFGNIVLSADFGGQTRWFAPQHVVWADLVLDDDEKKVVAAYRAAVAEAQQKAEEAERAAEAARAAAERARGGEVHEGHAGDYGLIGSNDTDHDARGNPL